MQILEKERNKHWDWKGRVLTEGEREEGIDETPEERQSEFYLSLFPHPFPSPFPPSTKPNRDLFIWQTLHFHGLKFRNHALQETFLVCRDIDGPRSNIKKWRANWASSRNGDSCHTLRLADGECNYALFLSLLFQILLHPVVMLRNPLLQSPIKIKGLNFTTAPLHSG